jgi:hypothetical protein
MAEIKTMSIMHRRVHGFIAWSGLLSLTYFIMLPAVLFAQTGTFPGEQAVPQPQPFNDQQFCAQKCEGEKQQCAAAAGNDPTVLESCTTRAATCYEKCKQVLPTPALPPQGQSTQPQQPQFSPDQCLKEKCAPLKEKCLAEAGADNDAAAKCEQMVGSCTSACASGNFNFQGQAPDNRGFQGPDFRGPNSQEHPGGKEGQQCQVDRVKKQMTQGLKSMASIKARVAALAKKGVKIPEELTKALASIDELSAQIRDAKDCQTLMDLEIGDKLQEAGEVLREQLPNLERLANAKTIFARVDRQIKQFERYLAADKKVAAKSKIDLNPEISAFESDLGKVKAAYASAKAKIDGGDVEGGFDDLEADVFDAFDGLGEHHNLIQQIGRLSTTISQASNQIKSFQAQLDALKKRGKDTAEAQGILDEGKAKLEEMKTAVKAQPINTDTVFDLLQALEDIRDRFTDALNDLKGIAEVKDVDQGLKMQKFELPEVGF